MIKKLIRFIKNYFRFLVLTTLLLSIIGVLINSIYTSTEIPIPEVIAESEEKIYDVKIVKAGKQKIYTKAIAKIENRSEMIIKAINGGVIKDLEIEEGDKLKKGGKILELDENYNGDNAIDIQIDIAEERLKVSKEKRDKLKDEFNDRKNIEEENFEDFVERIDINKDRLDNLEDQQKNLDEVIDEIENLIEDYEDFEYEIEDALDEDEFLEDQSLLQNNSGITNNKNAIEQYKNTVLSLEDQIRQLEYETSSNYPIKEVRELNKDLVIAQYRFEIEMADIEEELEELNLSLLELQKELNDVRSPIAGTVDRVFVKEGEVLNQGQDIFVLVGGKDYILKTLVSEEILKNINEKKDAILNRNSIFFYQNVFSSICFVDCINWNEYDIFFFILDFNLVNNLKLQLNRISRY